MGELFFSKKELLHVIFLFNDMNYGVEQLQFKHTEFRYNHKKAKDSYCVHNGKHQAIAFNLTEKLPEILDTP